MRPDDLVYHNTYHFLRLLLLPLDVLRVYHSWMSLAATRTHWDDKYKRTYR